MTESIEPPIFTLDTIGTLFDGHMGWHNIARLIDLAVAHGYAMSEEDALIVDAFRADGFNVGIDDDYIDGIDEIHDDALEHLRNLCAPGIEIVLDWGEVSITTLCRTESFEPHYDTCECGSCEVPA